MTGKYKVITLCGSIKFKENFIKAQRDLTLKGNIVLTPEFFEMQAGEADLIITEDVKQMLGDMHKCRIDMSDAILVLNKNGYIGSSTKVEIEYAKRGGKQVYYLES